MFERFTDRSRRVVALAQSETDRSGVHGLGTEHLLAGLIIEGESLAAQVLAAMAVSNGSLDAIRRPSAAVGRLGYVPFTDRARRVLELALREALQLGHNYIAPEHLLLAIVREGEGSAAKALVNLGLDLGDIRREVIAAIAGNLYDRGAISRDALIADEAARKESSESRWFVDTFLKWTFLLDETRGAAITIGGDFASRTKTIVDMVGSDTVAVDVFGAGLAAAEMLMAAGVNVIRVHRVAS